MRLSKLQRKFTHMIGLLICFSYFRGYELTFGDAFRDDRCNYGHPNSTHKVRLAVDFNLFIDGKYVSDGSHPAFRELHDYWTFIGGADPIEDDMNHFSIAYNGVR